MSARAVLPTRWGLVVGLAPLYLAAPLLLAVGMRVAWLEAFEADGPSMVPTLQHGDRFLVDKTAYGLVLPGMSEAVAHWGEAEPGDVVVLRSPMDELDIVKRVVALAGQTVEIREDVIYVDGAPLADGSPEPCPEEPEVCDRRPERAGDRRWWTTSASLNPATVLPPVRVPEGHVYVLGDHRDRSNDSRFIGPIPTSRLLGRAVGIYWHADSGPAWTPLDGSTR